MIEINMDEKVPVKKYCALGLWGFQIFSRQRRYIIPSFGND